MSLGKNGDIEWKCFYRLDEAEKHWRELMHYGNYRVFQDFDLVKTWFRTIGKESNVAPRIVVVTFDENPVILFPLGIYRSFGIRRLAWLGSDWNDYNGPVVGDHKLLASIPDVWGGVLKLIGEADILEVSKQAPCYGENLPNVIALPESVTEDNSTHILDLQSDEEALRASIHSSRTWQGFDRKRRKLEKMGDLTFHEEREPEEKRAIVSEMLRIKVEDLTALGKRNPFTSEGATQFLPSIAHDCPDISRVFTLRLDGEVIAITFCLVEEKTLLLYQTSYDKSFGYASPGALLLHSIIFKAAEEGYDTFDCLFGDDPYKLKICNRSVSVGRALVPISAIGVGLKYLTIGKIALTRKVKHSPFLFSTARKAKKLVTSFGTTG